MAVLRTYWMQPISISNSTGHIVAPPKGIPPSWAVRAYSVTTAYIETDDLGSAMSWIVSDNGLVPGIASGPGLFQVEARYLVGNAAATFILMIDFFF